MSPSWDLELLLWGMSSEGWIPGKEYGPSTGPSMRGSTSSMFRRTTASPLRKRAGERLWRAGAKASAGRCPQILNFAGIRLTDTIHLYFRRHRQKPYNHEDSKAAFSTESRNFVRQGFANTRNCNFGNSTKLAEIALCLFETNFVCATLKTRVGRLYIVVFPVADRTNLKSSRRLLAQRQKTTTRTRIHVCLIGH